MNAILLTSKKDEGFAKVPILISWPITLIYFLLKIHFAISNEDF